MNTGGATVNRDEIVSMYAGLYVNFHNVALTQLQGNEIIASKCCVSRNYSKLTLINKLNRPANIIDIIFLDGYVFFPIFPTLLVGLLV